MVLSLATLAFFQHYFSAKPLGLVLSILFGDSFADTIGVNRWFLISGILIMTNALFQA